MKLIKHTMDIDPNISIHEIFKTLHFLNEQPNLPLPSITIEITPDNLTRLKTQIWSFPGTIKKSPWHHKFSPNYAKTWYNGTILNKKGLNNE